MSDKMQRLRRLAPWIALPLVAVLAFAVGTCAAGNGDEAHEHEQAGEPEGGEGDEATVYTCSMHPQVRQPDPGKCPICGMDLIPATSDGAGAAEDQPDRITLSDRAKTLARIRTSEVRELETPGVTRGLLGRIEYDETTLKTVTAWTGGRIDRLRVATTGQRIREGQVIATIYSPEIYSAHQDLIAAKKHSQSIGEGAVGTANTALEATRQRLKLLGVPSGEIERMEKADAPWQHIPIRTPFGGTVIERIATEGSYISTGSALYEVAQLGRLWVQLDAYERDLPLLSVGQNVDIEVNALPGETFEGEVAFIDPMIDPQTRTAEVRIEVKNPDGKLLPGMFAEAVVKGKSEQVGERQLVIPESAPLFTGRRSVVYVEVPEAERPTYDMRVVKLGPKTGDSYPVIAGLNEGERVVTNGAFVLDADLQIRGGVSMMSVPDDTEEGPYDDIVPVSAEVRADLAEVLKAYLALHEALAADDLEAAKKAAERMDEARNEVGRPETNKARERWKEISELLASHGHHVMAAEDLDGARQGFEALSEQVKRLLASFGNPLDHPVHVAHCPMAFDNRGADWVQESMEIENAYFGDEMHSCGEIESMVEPGGYLGGEMDVEATGGGGGHQH